MKRLIVCNDGTWNSPDQEDNGIPSPTNVVKIYNALAEQDDQGVLQLKYYHPGVGAGGGILNAITGGAVGAGLSSHIRSAYEWIARHYEDGDEIYLFGFSRGAFTSRSLAGLCDRGLLDLDETMPAKDRWERVDAAYRNYRENRTNGPVSKWAKAEWVFHHEARSLPITFLGVWDTVGALGVPDDLELLNLFDDPDKWKFHDTKLNRRIKTARHAMAIDEVRASFTVTRWSNASSHPNAKEVWFPGVHSDVGGGYAQSDLSDGALLWMIEEAERVGLCYRDRVKQQIKPDALGVLHNSFKGAFSKLRSRPRNVAPLASDQSDQFHESAITRQKDSPIAYPAYLPTQVLAPGERSAPFDVYADTRWNETGLFMEAGTYTFSATGEWQDSKDSCDWRGTQYDGNFTAGDIVRSASTFLGKFEFLWKKATKNASTDFLGTKRVEKMAWFTLVGVVANDRGEKSQVPNDGSPDPHQYIQLSEHADSTKALELKAPGYFYAFANDVWARYDNNHGSLRLTVTRVT